MQGGYDSYLPNDITVDSYLIKGLPSLDPDETISFVVFLVNICDLNFGDLKNSPHSQQLVNHILHVYRQQFDASGQYTPYFCNESGDERTGELHKELLDLIGNHKGITLEKIASVTPDSLVNKAGLRVDLIEGVHRLYLQTYEQMTGKKADTLERGKLTFFDILYDNLGLWIYDAA